MGRKSNWARRVAVARGYLPRHKKHGAQGVPELEQETLERGRLEGIGGGADRGGSSDSSGGGSGAAAGVAVVTTAAAAAAAAGQPGLDPCNPSPIPPRCSSSVSGLSASLLAPMCVCAFACVRVCVCC
jgi:hypothetical protein